MISIINCSIAKSKMFFSMLPGYFKIKKYRLTVNIHSKSIERITLTLPCLFVGSFNKKGELAKIV